MYMLRKFIYILIFAILSSIAVTIVYTVTINDMYADTTVNIVTPTNTIAITSSPEQEQYEVVVNLVNKNPATEPTIEITLTPTVEITPSPTMLITATPKITYTLKPTNTPKPTKSPTSTPVPTPSPTNAPDYILINDPYFQSEVLRGVNYSRDVQAEKNPLIEHVVLSAELNALAEAHAIAMALKDEYSFHSNYGIVESVSSGTWIEGYTLGIASSGHATQLCMDEEIVRIGIGCAKSATGRVFTCVLGDRGN